MFSPCNQALWREDRQAAAITPGSHAKWEVSLYDAVGGECVGNIQLGFPLGNTDETWNINDDESNWDDSGKKIRPVLKELLSEK